MHFLDIASNGYRFEHSFAFYPLMPVVTGFVARQVAMLVNVMGFSGWGYHDGLADAGLNPEVVVGTGLAVSVASFVAMAVLL